MQEPRKKYTKTSDHIDERNKLEDLYLRQALSAAQIARKLNLSERTVWMRLAFHGLTAEHKSPKYCGECGHVVYEKRKRK